MSALLAALILSANPHLPQAADMAAHLALIEQRGGPPAAIMYGLVMVETGGTWNPRTRGRAGEVGLFQLHPCHKPPKGWTAQMDWAAGHLQFLRKKGGSWEVALAAYNGGWGGRHRARCKAYARKVLRRAKQCQMSGVTSKS